MAKSVSKIGKQYRISSSLLLLFSAPFIVWQMGILYFSGTTMSLFGRTPVPLESGDTTAVIAAGYAASILLMCLFPRKTVYIQRAVLPTAFVSTALMLLPLPASVLCVLFYVCAFACVFSIGTMLSIAAQHFTVETTWREGVISMTLGGVLIALLQNDVFKIDFTAFTVFALLLTAAQAAFYFAIPAKIEVDYASRENPVRMPKTLFIGIWLISGMATLLICFASSFAESVRGGVSVLYLSAAVFAPVIFFLKKKLGAGSVRVFGGFLALSSLGFVLAYLSLRIPALRYVACVLLGMIVVLANLWIYFGALSFSIYPFRFIGALGAAMGMMLAALHSELQDALRADLSVLYGIYAALSVALLVAYYFIEPYFSRMLARSREPVLIKPAQRPHRSHVPPSFDVLSEQERILAGLILDGHSESSAARAMNISLNTQKGYRKNIYFKLDIHSKRELFEAASEQTPRRA